MLARSQPPNGVKNTFIAAAGHARDAFEELNQGSLE